MEKFGIGQSIKRFEDPRLVRGEGRFHNDVNLPGQAHVVIVRSFESTTALACGDAAGGAGAGWLGGAVPAEGAALPAGCSDGDAAPATAAKTST